jgi:hypothetical protein
MSPAQSASQRKDQNPQPSPLRASLLEVHSKFQEEQAAIAREAQKKEMEKWEQQQKLEEQRAVGLLAATKSEIRKLPKLLKAAVDEKKTFVTFPIQYDAYNARGVPENLELIKRFCERHQLYGVVVKNASLHYADYRYGKSELEYSRYWTTVEIHLFSDRESSGTGFWTTKDKIETSSYPAGLWD